MKKKTVSLILAMMLLVTALSGCGGTGSSSKPENNATEADAGEKTESAEPVQEATEPAQEASEPAGEGTKEDVQFAGGSGTAEDPWQIATAEQLDRVRDDLKAHYVLTDDILGLVPHLLALDGALFQYSSMRGALYTAYRRMVRAEGMEYAGRFRPGAVHDPCRRTAASQSDRFCGKVPAAQLQGGGAGKAVGQSSAEAV